jgi:flagellar protein FliO/FliZ
VITLRRPAAPLPARRPMARPVDSARPRIAEPTLVPAGSSELAAGAATYSPFRLPSLAVLTVGTRLASFGLAIDMVRLRHPRLLLVAAGSLGLALALTLVGHPVGAGGSTAARSALDALGGSATSATGAAIPTDGSASSLLGGSVDPVDLVVKGGLVVVLLFVTLRILRRVQGGSVPADARIRVIESRTLGAKTQLHLVAIGNRQVLIGATPGRLVTLAELPAAELTSDELPAAELDGAASVELASGASASASASASAPDRLDPAPDGSFAAALGRARAGLAR